MSDDRTIDPLAVISLAKERGLNGWGGHCASAALAINRLLFNGQGVYLGSLVSRPYRWACGGDV